MVRNVVTLDFYNFLFLLISRFFSDPDLRETIPSILEPSWALMILAEIGVPYLDILDAFENTTTVDGLITSRDDEKRRYLSRGSAAIKLLQDWISSTRSDNTFAKHQLLHAISNGSLMSKIDNMKSQLVSIPEASNLLDMLRSIVDDLRILN
jgi:hypothetical protein